MLSFHFADHIRIYTESLLMMITDTDVKTKVIISDIDDNIPNGTKNRMAYIDKKIGSDKYAIAIDASDLKKEDPCIISCDPMVLQPYITREESLLICAKNINEYAKSILAPSEFVYAFVSKDDTKIIVSHNFFATNDGYYEYSSVPREMIEYILGHETFDDVFMRFSRGTSVENPEKQ